MTKRTENPAPKRAAAMAIAVCTQSLTSSASELQLLPAGAFRARDGRPAEVAHWFIDAAIAQRLIAAAAARDTPYVIDYEHQTLRAEQNGKPAPAAGWFHKLEWREGVGLFAIDVEWTEPAKTMIQAKEYKFISPVFGYDDTTGAVTFMLMAAITNTPAVDGMEQVFAAASLQITSLTTQPTNQENSMEELMQRMRYLLNLPEGATPEDAIVQLDKLKASLMQDKAVTAAASFNLNDYIAGQRTTIVALSTATPDPAKFMPVSAVTSLQSRVAALTIELNEGKVEDLVSGAIAQGKLLPAQEEWARDLGAKNIAALTAFIDSAPNIAILATSTQTNGKEPAGSKLAALTDSQLQLCRAMGVAPEDFLKTMKAEQAAA